MAGADPLLSILMVNWNTRDMTLACLRSIYVQTERTPFEIILVDNGSTDGSANAIAHDFPAVRLLAEDKNHGFAHANNLAAAQARGEYLLLLNTDTLVLDQAIDRLVDFAQLLPRAGIWGGRTWFANGRLNPSSVWGRITPWSAVSAALGLRALFRRSAFFNSEGYGGWERDSIRPVDIVSGCFLLIDRNLWNRLGGFDGQFFMYGEEADLCARARALGAQPMMTPEATIVHYGGASSAGHASKIAYVMGARIGLMNRHLTGWGRHLGQQASLLHVWLRAASFRLLAGLAPQRFAARAHAWSQVWQDRHRWAAGPGHADLRAPA